MNELVSTKWLFNNLNDKKLVILDCSWFLPKENKDPKRFYKKQHIKGSYFFDINEISDKKNKFPHMVPNLEFFKKKTKNFNIHKDSKIITYSNENLMGSSRVWWMFKYFSFNNVYVLNGGFSKWLKEKKPITKRKSNRKLSSFIFKIDNTLICNKKDIIKFSTDKKKIIFDARNKNRYQGIEKETRLGVRAGHIPNSKNLFWRELTYKGTSLLNKKLIIKKFSNYDFRNKDIIFSCGSGISACVLYLSVKHALAIKGSVYDGSWSEWGSKKNLPVAR